MTAGDMRRANRGVEARPSLSRRISGISLLLLAAGFGLFLAACSSGKQAEKTNSPGPDLPGWVIDPPRKPGYVYGVGSAQLRGDKAKALQQASDFARVELIKKLRVSIRGRTSSRVELLEKDGRSHLTRKVVQAAESSIEDTELPGIDIVESLAAPSEQRVYALAELNSQQAAADCRQKIARLDDRLQPFRSKALQGDTLQKAQALLPALRLLQKRRRLVRKLQLLDPSAGLPELTSSQEHLLERIVTLLDTLKIGIAHGKGSANPIEASLRKALIDAGFKVSLTGQTDLLLQYSVDLQISERKGIFFVTASAAATLLNRQKDVLGEFQDRSKGAARDEGLARSRALDDLAESLGKSIGQDLYVSLTHRQSRLGQRSTE